MAAENQPTKPKRSEGQSVIEFLLMLPVMIALTMLMLKINTAIQVAIVNQKYARAQTLTLAYNSAVYPRIGARISNLIEKKFDQMVLGVSENTIPKDGTSYNPIASVVNVGIKSDGSNAPKQEPDSRSKVRVRNTVTLCTQANQVFVGGRPVPILEIAQLGPEKFGPAGDYKLNENVSHRFCRSPMEYTNE